MLRSSRSLGNPLLRRVHRHINMTTLFRSMDYQLPQDFGGGRERRAVPLVVATLPQAAAPEAVSLPEETAMAVERPASQMVTPEAVPQRLPAPPTGIAAPVAAPQPRTVTPPVVQRQVPPAARSVPVTAPTTSPAAPAQMQPPPPVEEQASQVKTEYEKNDPIWRRLQTIFRKHEEKGTLEEPESSEIEPSSDSGKSTKKASGEASASKEKAPVQRQAAPPAGRDVPVQRQVQVEEIGPAPAPVIAGRRIEPSERSQPAGRPQGVQVPPPLSTEQPAAADTASFQPRAEEAKPAPVQAGFTPAPVVQRAEDKVMPAETPAPVQSVVQEEQSVIQPAPAWEAPTQISAPPVQRAPAAGTGVPIVRPASEAAASPARAETAQIVQRQPLITQPQPEKPAPFVQPGEAEFGIEPLPVDRPVSDQAGGQEPAQPTVISPATAPSAVQRAPVATTPSPAEARQTPGVPGPRQAASLPPAGEYIEPDDADTIIQGPLQAAPLESVWPVQIIQRSAQVEPAVSEPARPAVIRPPEFLEKSDGEPVYDTLKNILPGQPTDSPLELIRPRKPRPTAAPIPEPTPASADTGKEKAPAAPAPVQTRPEVVQAHALQPEAGIQPVEEQQPAFEVQRMPAAIPAAVPTLPVAQQTVAQPTVAQPAVAQPAPVGEMILPSRPSAVQREPVVRPDYVTQPAPEGVRLPDGGRVPDEGRLQNVVRLPDGVRLPSSELPVVRPLPAALVSPVSPVSPVRPVRNEATQAATVQRASSEQPAPAAQAAGIEMVPTGIGPLPADLWTLIDQVPEASQPAAPAARPAAVEAPQPMPALQTHREPAPAPDAVSPAIQRQVFERGEVTHTPAGMVIQLAEAVETPPAAGQLQGEAPEQAPQTSGGEVNVDELAMRVYGEVKRRLIVEWERLRRRF